MSEIDISYKFQPLFEILEGQHADVDTVIMTGGRSSGKSFAVAVHSLVSLVDYNWSTLYARFTNISIEDSIKEEVSSKIEILNYQNKVNDTINRIEHGKNRIAFKGIKTGSRQQTANLKSLSGFNCFIVDEAEEIPDYETFKKVYYSIRSVDKRNISVLILNPTTKQHWIFGEYFNKPKVEPGFCGIKNNVLYIHTSYLDVNPEYIAENIRKDYERLKIEHPTKYDNIVLGGWIEDIEGVLIPKSQINFADLSGLNDSDIQFRFSVGDPADTGGDKYSMPFIDVIEYEGQLACYVRDVIHNTQGIDANTYRIIDKARDNSTEQIFIESNGVGLAAVLLIKRTIGEHIRISAFPSTINKEVRIFSHYEFVQKYFIFDKEKYETNAEYKLFVEDLTSYSKESDNKNKKDAIDVLCSAASIMKIKYKKVLYG